MRWSSLGLVAFFVCSVVHGDDAGVGAGGDASVDGGADAGTVVAVPLRPFADGEFRLVDEASADAAVNGAVETAIRGLHPSMRDAFRTQLRSTLRFPRRIRVERTAQTTAIVWDGARLEAPKSGEERRQVGPEGRPFGVAFRNDGGGVAAVFRTGGFTRTNRLAGTDTGVHMEATLRSGLLATPIVVSASYARVP